MKKITNASALILSALMLFGCTSNSATGGVGDTTPPSESSVTESKKRKFRRKLGYGKQLCN